MLKVCKFSLYKCKTTQDLTSENDQNSTMACTSSLQKWHKIGQGETIFPQPIMDIIVEKTKLEDVNNDGIRCNLYEARQSPQIDEDEVNELKRINPTMALAKLNSNQPSTLVDTKFGQAAKGHS